MKRTVTLVATIAALLTAYSIGRDRQSIEDAWAEHSRNVSALLTPKPKRARHVPYPLLVGFIILSAVIWLANAVIAWRS